MVGYTLAGVGVLAAIVQGGLIKKIVGALGERHALLFGLACGTLGFALYGLAPTGYWFWAMMPIAALWGVAGPAAQAIMTHHVDPREQGRLQGAVASLSAIAGIIAPTLFTRTFAAVTQANMHGAWAGITFGLAALMVGGALVLAWYTVSHLPATASPATQPPESIVTSEIIAGAAELQPPLNESETRA
jgi:DHA1 family tetracycline resistance protein-like MFS transporter